MRHVDGDVGAFDEMKPSEFVEILLVLLVVIRVRL